MATVEQLCDEIADLMQGLHLARMARWKAKTGKTHIEIAEEIESVVVYMLKLADAIDARVAAEPSYTWTAGEKLREGFRAKNPDQGFAHEYFASSLWKKAQHSPLTMAPYLRDEAAHQTKRAGIFRETAANLTPGG